MKGVGYASRTFVDTYAKVARDESDFKVIEPTLLKGTYEFTPRVCAG